MPESKSKNNNNNNSNEKKNKRVTNIKFNWARYFYLHTHSIPASNFEWHKISIFGLLLHI
jgi:hypothetical protein